MRGAAGATETFAVTEWLGLLSRAVSVLCAWPWRRCGRERGRAAGEDRWAAGGEARPDGVGQRHAVAVGADHVAEAIFGRDGDRLVAGGIAGRDRRAGTDDQLGCRTRADGDRLRARGSHDGLVESMAEIVHGPAVSKVATTVATPPVNDRLLNVMPPAGSLSVTVSAKPVIGLPRLSSAVIVKASGLPAVGFVFEALTTNFAVAVGETVTFAVTEWPDVSRAVSVCAPAVASVAVNVAVPPEKITGPLVAKPPTLSDSVTWSPSVLATLPKLSSAVTVTSSLLVVLLAVTGELGGDDPGLAAELTFDGDRLRAL